MRLKWCDLDSGMNDLFTFGWNNTWFRARLQISYIDTALQVLLLLWKLCLNLQERNAIQYNAVILLIGVDNFQHFIFRKYSERHPCGKSIFPGLFPPQIPVITKLRSQDNRIHFVISDLNMFSAAFLRPPTSPTLTCSSPHPPPEESHYDETCTRKLQFTSTRGTGFIMAAFPWISKSAAWPELGL